MLILFAVARGYAQERNGYDSIPTPSLAKADCHPSLALEIGVTTLVLGVPSFWIWREPFDADSNEYLRIRGLFLPLDLLILVFTLGPVAESTSDCEASYWHAAWIGLVSDFICSYTYGAVYGFNHKLDNHKFNLPEFLALGVAPSVLTVFAYNLFQHPKESKTTSMMLYPSLGRGNTASLNFLMQF
ncbi:MAG: hypothetical protein JSS75_11575 [Bacteroidetes bacterium]|nr:hypothetical protein [Bacteroidota bacterium]